MVDYQSNSKKSKSESEVKPEVKKVVVGEVTTRKRPIGKKFKDLFVGEDAKSVMHYIFIDVMVPAARDLIVDASTKAIERMVYGGDNVSSGARSRSQGSRVVYNTPVRRGGARGYSVNRNPGVRNRSSYPSRSDTEDFILSSREEADMVLDSMNDIIDQYGEVSVADLNELVGFPSTHTDNRWGWGYPLTDVQIRQSREGFIIDFPRAEPI